MKSNLPLVTIFVPSYNHGRYVSDCIRSLVGQTYPNTELIVVDDGSTDNSVEIITSLQDQYKFRFITQGNKGLTATLNDAFFHYANGEYIFLFASDDIAKPDAIEVLIDYYLSSNDRSIGCVFGDNVYINEHGDEVYKNNGGKHSVANDSMRFKTALSYYKYHYPELNNESHFLSYESFLSGSYLPVGVLLNKSIVKKIGGYQKNVASEDYDMCLKMSRSFRLACVQNVTAWYRLKTSTSKTRMLGSFNSAIILLKRERKFLLTRKQKRILDRNLSNICVSYFDYTGNFYWKVPVFIIFLCFSKVIKRNMVELVLSFPPSANLY